MPPAPDPYRPSRHRNEAPAPSRRSVLATGSAIGGTLVVGGAATVPARAATPGAPATTAPAPVTVHSPDDAWRTVLDDADLLWQKLPKTWYEGPYLGNGRLGSGIYAEPGATTTAVRFNVQHSEVQDHRPEFGSLFGLAQSLHDMVCQSWGGTIRVFPALPAAWRELTVHDFRTQGAFLLSAVREGGRTRWVRVTSEAGAPCVVRHGIEGAVEIRDRHGRPLEHEELADGTVRIHLRTGDSALITAKGDRPDLTIRPVTANEPAPRWGLPA
ncbi:glycoside hydrolase family 95-like protein [Streptomyces sp. NPDC058439]|uniref:glycoside hydrolase family 95-like protein n=1 Tax=Streptomyces sp. NPDC058439 TaxID=3346500 RepID=UPI0036560928